MYIRDSTLLFSVVGICRQGTGICVAEAAVPGGGGSVGQTAREPPHHQRLPHRPLVARPATHPHERATTFHPQNKGPPKGSQMATHPVCGQADLL